MRKARFVGVREGRGGRGEGSIWYCELLRGYWDVFLSACVVATWRGREKPSTGVFSGCPGSGREISHGGTRLSNSVVELRRIDASRFVGCSRTTRDQRRRERSPGNGEAYFISFSLPPVISPHPPPGPYTSTNPLILLPFGI